jgi:hypothetical protein
MKTISLVVLLVSLLALVGGSTRADRSGPGAASDGVPATATPSPLGARAAIIARDGIPPTLTPTPSPTPSPTPDTRTALEICRDHPDRYNWRPYALAAGFPDWVLPELEGVIRVESTFDLCAINRTSGATCWIQQYPGGEEFLDPAVCMDQGFMKWEAGGRDFWQHWRQWWGR